MISKTTTTAGGEGEIEGFTRGPWRVLDEEPGVPYLRVRGTRLGLRYKVANVLSPNYPGSLGAEVEESRANAALIAQAPTLYAENATLRAANKRLEQQLEAVFAHMAAFADSEYVRGCHIAQRDECKGWEHKAKTGKYGQAEYEAHKQFDEAMGAHFGIYKAIKSARAALTSNAAAAANGEME